MSPVTRLVAGLLVLPIHIYRRLISPLFPPRCRFHPTCSAYALAAIQGHGPIRGTALALRRLVRCHPWNVGGLDPVPEPVTRPPHPG